MANGSSLIILGVAQSPVAARASKLLRVAA
jgi:hypothetical protein